MELKDLAPNPNNPRKISDEKLKMLKKSLDVFGDLSGFVFNRATGRLVSGHQRLKVLPQAAVIVPEITYPEPTETGTIVQGYVDIQGERFKYREVMVDDATEKAMNVAANQHGGEFDMAILPEWLNDLDGQNIDLDLLGFDAKELENIMAPVGGFDSEAEEDTVPEVRPNDTRVQLGDLFILGDHRLYCGDSTDKECVEKLMNGEKADMVFTDPPYGINEKTERIDASRERNAKSTNWKRIAGDENTDLAKKISEVVIDLAPTVILWGANFYCHALPETGNWLVWDKRVEDKQRDDNSDCELAWVQTTKRSVRIFRHLWKGMIKASEHGERRVHPTQKPVALADWSFETYGSPKSVLDLFGGSGSTLIACEKTKRKCFMMELDPHYCAVILDRWAKFTGNDPIREDGTPWSTI